MIVSMNSGLDFYRQVLELRAYRQEILSADIANASTPGFKAVDLDFAEALGNAQKSRQDGARLATPRGVGRVWLVDNSRHIQVGPKEDSVIAGAMRSVKYQADAGATLDGNSVSLDHQKLAAAENAIQYEAAATFAAQTVKMMLIAINGSGPTQTGG